MEEPAYRDQIYTDFSLALEKDPARPNITKIGELGLIEDAKANSRIPQAYIV